MDRVFLTLMACALVTAQAGSQGQPAGAAQPEQVVRGGQLDGEDAGESRNGLYVTVDHR